MIRSVTFAIAIVAVSLPGWTAEAAESVEYDLEYRIWRDVSGKELNAQFIRFSGIREVVLRRHDTKNAIKVAIERFSEKDRELLNRIRVYIAEKERNEEIAAFAAGYETLAEAIKTDRDLRRAVEANPSKSTLAKKQETDNLWKQVEESVGGMRFTGFIRVDDVNEVGRVRFSDPFQGLPWKTIWVNDRLACDDVKSNAGDYQPGAVVMITGEIVRLMTAREKIAKNARRVYIDTGHPKYRLHVRVTAIKTLSSDDAKLAAIAAEPFIEKSETELTAVK